MAKVRELGSVKPVVDEGMVYYLQALLKAAKAGKLISLAFAGETNSGKILRGHCTDHPKASKFSLIGALEYEKHSLLGLIDAMNGEEFPSG